MDLGQQDSVRTLLVARMRMFASAGVIVRDRCEGTHRGEGPPAKATVIVPAYYNLADTSGLTATINEGETNEFTFDLKK